jgi:outer membrane protein assembly factor BamB
VLHRRPDLGLATLLVAGAALVLAGCSKDGDDGMSTSSGASGMSTTVEGGTLAERVEASYVIGPAAARDLGYRVDWQYPSSGSPIKQVVVVDDSVFTLDELNFLTRLRRDEGDRLWRVPVANPVERIFGVSYVPSLERIFLTTGSDLLVLDAASGSRIDKQNLEHTANTAPIVLGQFLVYGSRNGMVAWHSYLLGTPWRAYSISRSVWVTPVYEDGHIIAVGGDGRVMSLLAESASQVWSRKALDRIVARPVAGNGATYVASLDQHLRAYDIERARSPLWEYLTESPLREAPVLIRDRVYQQVPTEGLVCLEALPLDSPGGVVNWRATGVTGNVVTERTAQVITWDGEEKVLTTVDTRHGDEVVRLDMPQVDDILATSVLEGNLYATGTDGRIVRLVPRN